MLLGVVPVSLFLEAVRRLRKPAAFPARGGVILVVAPPAADPLPVRRESGNRRGGHREEPGRPQAVVSW